MDNQRDKLAVARLCRFCLSRDNPLTNIYDKNIQNKDVLTTKNLNLPMKILLSISVECFPSDKMPMYICNRCIFFMDIVYKFKNICREADSAIAQFLHTGSPLESMKWTPALLKVFNTMQKQNPDVEVLKIEGGPTVHVSQDGTDTEDEDEDVYSVRIGDGTQGGTSACVKVVTKEEPAKGKKRDLNIFAPEHGLFPFIKREFEQSSFGVDFADGANDEEEGLLADVPKLTRRKLEPGSWGCDECNNSYPLQQLLELHKMQKHRNRSFVCDICEAKFFSRYDLETHMIRHDQDVQFQCVACDKNFKRDVLLRRHERSMHPEMLKHKCHFCPASFIEQEDLTAHSDRHHQRERKYHCTICSKKFLDKYSLTRHQLIVHSMRTWLACEYCPERFNSVSKLTRHVRSHAGERAYPCKFCNKRFSKSHHCTRHMRIKHADLVTNEEFSCEECSATFSNQEDLIYHSACHATVNCICPLCQEKFPDVDAVTAHIKTHGNGNEFMCDYCELMFTSNEKLESHLMRAHPDEMEGSGASRNGEDSMEMGGEGDFDDGIQVKEEGDQMIVEINKPNSFLKNTEAADDKMNYPNSEESEPELPVAEPVPQPSEAQPAPTAKQLPLPPALTPATTLSPVAAKAQTARDIAIVQKAEEERRKAAETPPEKKADKPKVETDKSLRLLEKELQELQRTNKREETPKAQTKPMETLRNRRAQIHTSTPKLRSAEEKKTPVQAKPSPADKKTPVEKRGVKENKKPEETKDKKQEESKVVNNNAKDEGKNGKNKEEKDIKIKEDKETTKEDKETKSKEEKEMKSKEEKEIKSKEEKESKKEEKDSKKEEKDSKKEEKESKKEEKESKKEEKESKKDEKESKKEEKDGKNNVSKEEAKEKNAVKNGAAIKTPEDGGVRRSSRASKVKDYAKMVQNKTNDTAPSDDDSDDSDDDNYVEAEKTEGRQKKRLSQKVTPKAVAPKAVAVASPNTNTPPPRKRGRPRKTPIETEVPTKVKKADASTNEANTSQDEKMDVEDSTNKDDQPSQPRKDVEKTEESKKTETPTKAASEPKAISPGIHPTASLKKVPIKSLPPGVKPLPLPTGARPLGASEISEMQIGKKVVKVQTIVMTKAEVEAMAKKGLVEMKDGTMVLKPGVKLADPTLKSIVAEKTAKETVKAAPTRCELDA